MRGLCLKGSIKTIENTTAKDGDKHITDPDSILRYVIVLGSHENEVDGRLREANLQS